MRRGRERKYWHIGSRVKDSKTSQNFWEKQERQERKKATSKGRGILSGRLAKEERNVGAGRAYRNRDSVKKRRVRRVSTEWGKFREHSWLWRTEKYSAEIAGAGI